MTSYKVIRRYISISWKYLLIFRTQKHISVLYERRKICCAKHLLRRIIDLGRSKRYSSVEMHRLETRTCT